MRKTILLLLAAMALCFSSCEDITGSDNIGNNTLTIGDKTYQLDTFYDPPVDGKWDPHAYDVTNGTTGDNVFILTEVNESMFNKTYDLTKHSSNLVYSIWIRAFNDNFDGGASNFKDDHDCDFSSGSMTLTYKNRNLRIEIDAVLADGRNLKLDMTVTPNDMIQ